MAIGIIVAFYSIFFLLGVSASRWLKTTTTNDLLLARRRLPLWLATLTLISTWVGGGYIVGTSEAIFDPAIGLVGTQAPWGFALSLILGGLFFAKPIRRRNCTTMLDLFEQRYSSVLASLLYVPALLGELFWIAAILSALGSVFGTVLEIDSTTAIVVSSVVALAYTLVGGLWSVALTDAVQLLCIVAGLLIALPFALQQVGGTERVLAHYQQTHLETFRLLPTGPAMTVKDRSVWFDTALLLVLGGIPWQVYFQRVLACRTDRGAVWLSIVAGFGCLVIAVPCALIGMIGVSVDWQSVAGQTPEPQAALPYVLKYLTPPVVALMGLSAVAAAVMSSIDSSMLSVSSMFAWNVYRPLAANRTSDDRLKRVMRIAMTIVCVVATTMAVRVGSVYNLWYLSADLVYVILFPQLVCGLFDRQANKFGATAGAIVGLLFRIAGGEASIGLPSLITLPDVLPFRTSVMLASLVTILIVSRGTGRWSEKTL